MYHNDRSRHEIRHAEERAKVYLRDTYWRRVVRDVKRTTYATLWVFGCFGVFAGVLLTKVLP